jgi:hypothetical protein
MRLTSYATHGTIRRGKLHLKYDQRWIDAVRAMPDGDVLITIRPATATRSLEMNKAYWAGYVRPLSEDTGYSPLAIHQYLKQKFLKGPHLFIADDQGEIVDEAEIEPTTTTLTRDEFSEYLEHISDFASSLGVTVGSRERELVGK